MALAQDNAETEPTRLEPVCRQNHYSQGGLFWTLRASQRAGKDEVVDTNNDLVSHFLLWEHLFKNRTCDK